MTEAIDGEARELTTIDHTTGEIVEYLPAPMQEAMWLVQSGFLPAHIRTPQQAFAIIQMGKELGLQPMAALNQIYVIQGKPTASTQLMLALAQRSGELEDFDVEADDNQATCYVKRRGVRAHTEVFTFEDAKKLGLASRDQWQKQRANMLKHRAIAANLRITFADVIMGLYTPDEMGGDRVLADGETPIREQAYARGSYPTPWPTTAEPEPVDAGAALDAFEKMLANDKGE